MQLPEKLYKYRAATPQDLINLSGAKMWFSDPVRFNDPFDCAFDIKLPELTGDQCLTMLREAYGWVAVFGAA